MERTYVKDTIEKINQTVKLDGWVAVRRDHGKLIFLDLRDKTGLVQLVINPKVSAVAHASANELRNEFVIEVEGLVKARDEKLINANLLTGKVEIEVIKLTVLSRAKALPFELENTKAVNEEVRLKYRYLDLRSERMTKNIRLRHKVTTLAREYLNENGFVEIETPLLTKTSPEGARDFLVPSRLQPGKFYALPQAPQQYKQLLMIAGFERYYQMAHALRDEDLRGDRQLEHTQIDLEMSFVKERDVLDMVEGMFIKIAEALGKKILKKPFPVFTHEEAMKQFGADKFDLRGDDKDPNTLAFAWVVDFPLLEWNEDEKKFTFAHNPFSAPKSEHVEKLMKGEDLGKLSAQQYDLVCNGFELASGGVRISDPTVQRKVFEIMGLSPEVTEERFGHLINAYEYGAPPHAGMAPGLDRFVMILANEENIREVIAFPVNSSGQTSVMDAPSKATPKQLKELQIKLDLPVEKK
ncbi:MAG TPA: aspartate--tRNA ligase [Patescibacteria group bacterium]|jgi:aspartyl-tRNA synthetase|nr:aspartate--tRNA ligase [Patescibacteria group bacterium]